MADKGVGALLVISEGGLVGIISERDYAPQSYSQGKILKGDPGEADHDEPGVLRDSAANRGRVHGHHDKPPHTAPSSRGRRAHYGVVSIGDLVRWIISTAGSDHSATGALHHGKVSGLTW